MWLTAGLVVLAYLLGSIPTGVLLARARGVDITGVGSGNIGASNVARNLGRKVGVVVFLLDAAKGALPALLARALVANGRLDPFAVTAVGFTAVAGHCFPVWLAFRGGKGVSTSLGVMLALAPLASVIAGGVWLALYKAFHIASVGSLVAVTLFIPLLLVLGAGDELVALAIAIAALILVQHRSNIVRLVRGAENKV